MTTTRNLVIIPTRGRGENIKARLIDNLAKSCVSDYVLALDNDDDADYGWAKEIGVQLNKGPSTSMSAALNRVATEKANEYEYLSFLGDDHRVITNCWDSELLENVKASDMAVAFGNDLLTDPPLATFVMLDARIVQRLGYMAPPSLSHMFLDNFWMLLGRKLNSLVYEKDVIVEHEHFSTGKSTFDDTYKATNKHSRNLKDRVRFNWYKAVRLNKDLKLLRVD